MYVYDRAGSKYIFNKYFIDFIYKHSALFSFNSKLMALFESSIENFSAEVC